MPSLRISLRHLLVVVVSTGCISLLLGTFLLAPVNNPTDKWPGSGNNEKDTTMRLDELADPAQHAEIEHNTVKPGVAQKTALKSDVAREPDADPKPVLKANADPEPVLKPNADPEPVLKPDVVDKPAVIPDVGVVWYANFDRSYHSRGLIYESINFLVPLFEMVSNIGWWSAQDAAKLYSNEFINDFRESDRKIIQQMFGIGESILKSEGDQEFIGIIAEQPHEYGKIMEQTAMGRARYRVGRAMYETTWIPHYWEDYINKYLDELWVPSLFASRVFKSAGVTVPVYVIQEGFDPKLFTKELTFTLREQARRKFFTECHSDDVIFFAVGKLEERKGIELLEAAFDDVFTKDDPVCLYIRSPGANHQNDVLEPLQIKGKRVYIIHDKLTMEELVLAYQSADVFALPTHGEGWGRPIMEAMAAGLPVITTYWSGQTEYIRPEYALLINVTSLETAYKNEYWYIGGREYQHLHKWAKVDINQLKDHLKWCVLNRDKLPEIGQKAKLAMFNYFTREDVARQVNRRLNEIRRNIS